MSLILTREQSRQLDQDLIEGAGVPSVLLMENAGRGAAEIITREFPSARQLFIFCGTGNNGGDGFVVGRRWLTLGKPVSACLVGERSTLSPEARAALDAFVAVGGDLLAWSNPEVESALNRADVVVDALFGTGLTRPIEGVQRQAVERMNETACPVVSLDLPSGLDANTGQVLGVCVRADVTVTFGLPKRGCFTFSASRQVGLLRTVDIGAPLPVQRLTGAVCRLCERSDVTARLARRPRVGHKGRAGHVAVVAGSLGTLGAARLAARSAFRSGAGVVTVVTGEAAATALGGDAWEVMVRSVGRDYAEPQGLLHWVNGADAVVFGPGLGVSEVTAHWLEGVLGQFRGVVVLDADGLTSLSQNPELRARCSAELVLTPHPGEAARLLGCKTEEVEADRFTAAHELARRYDAAVVLKGAPSLVAAPGETWIAPRGHACLATAGSGDVLSGIVGALGAHLAPLDAAIAGSWLHATVGERLGAGRHAGRGLLAREIADAIPDVLAEFAAQDAAERRAR